MDVRSILDSLMAAGKNVSSQATNFAEKNLGLPSDPQSKSEVLKTVGAGAAIGSIATLLLGTKAGRKISGKLAVAGTLAAAGTVAYKAYQQWANSQGKTTSEQSDAPMATLTGVSADRRSLTILRAMIAAANADGQIDASENSAIDEQMKQLDLPEDSQEWVRKELRTPRNAWGVASLSDSPAAAAEIYAVSSLIVDHQNEAEKAYLEDLRSALQLDPGFVKTLAREFSVS